MIVFVQLLEAPPNLKLIARVLLTFPGLVPSMSLQELRVLVEVPPLNYLGVYTLVGR